MDYTIGVTRVLSNQHGYGDHVLQGFDPVNRYIAHRQEMESCNRPVEDGTQSGIEGAVWYITDPNGHVSLWKCKPQSVAGIHWATRINKASVVATCWNALETSDVLTYDVLFPLLLEEYDVDEIERYRQQIEVAIAEVNRESAFRQRVLAAYAEIQAEGLSLRADKTAVMRALSSQFGRDEIERVYKAIARKEGI